MEAIFEHRFITQLSELAVSTYHLIKELIMFLSETGGQLNLEYGQSVATGYYLALAALLLFLIISMARIIFKILKYSLMAAILTVIIILGAPSVPFQTALMISVLLFSAVLLVKS